MGFVVDVTRGYPYANIVRENSPSQQHKLLEVGIELYIFLLGMVPKTSFL